MTSASSASTLVHPFEAGDDAIDQAFEMHADLLDTTHSADDDRPNRLFEEICDRIRADLASGVLKPGDKLPAERELAQHFDVGRPAVREALRTLEISGIVSLQKGSKGGAFIRAGDPTMISRPLRDLVLLGSVNLEQLAEARILMTEVLVRLACERGTEADFDQLEEVIDRIERTPEIGTRTEAGILFFKLIARATRNDVLTLLIDALGELVRRVTERIERIPQPALVAIRRELLAAMRARQPELAVRLVQRYMSVSRSGMDSGRVKLGAARSGQERAVPRTRRSC